MVEQAGAAPEVQAIDAVLVPDDDDDLVGGIERNPVYTQLATGNERTYFILEALANLIPAEYLELDDIVFHNTGTFHFGSTTQKALYWEAIQESRLAAVCKKLGRLLCGRSATGTLGISALFYVLRDADHLTPHAGEPDAAFYAAVIGSKSLPARMMLCQRAEECFLRLSPAFCSELTGEHVCDLDMFGVYDVKDPSLPRYGGRAVVLNGAFASIDGVTPDKEEEFQPKLWRFLATFAVHVVFDRHAVMTHLATTQRLMIKLTHESKKKAILRKDPLTLLVKALTTRVNEVSLNEQLLIGHGRSLVGRATAFTNDALVRAGRDLYKKYSSMAPNDLIALLADGSPKWKEACNIVWKAALQVVKVFTMDGPAYGLHDEDIQDLSLMLWISTFYHGFIGDFQLDNLMKGNLPLLCTGAPHIHNLSYAKLATTIGATTMTRTLTVADIATELTLLGVGSATEQAAWGTYVKELSNVQTGIASFDGAHAVYAAVNF